MDNLPANVNTAIEQLRTQNQIATKGFLGIAGTTIHGQEVFFPDSLQRGYRDELTPYGQKPSIVWEIPGIVSLDSNGDYNFLPSYNQGRDMGKDIKINVVAAVAMKAAKENEELQRNLQKLQNKLDELGRGKL